MTVFHLPTVPLRHTALRWLRTGMLAAAASSLVLLAAPGLATAAGKQPAQTLVYLDARPHNSLYPPNGGYYPNGAILNQIADKLTYQNPETLAIEPWLADSWTINEDATEYTFQLRSGVTFSDGTPLDAAAVARNFDVFGQGNKALKHSSSEVINNYERSEVLDPLTVRFHFSRPSPGFLQGTSVIGSSIVSPATLELSSDELGDGTKVIASGPFVIVRDVPGRETVLKARDDYAWGPQKLAHQGRAKLDEIRIVVTPEDGVRVGALLSRQAGLIRQVQAYDEPRVQQQGFAVYGASTRGVNHSLAFRPDNARVADVRVRRALLHATDRDAIIATLFTATYPKARSIIVASAAGFVDLSDQLGYDPAKANALLDEAGWVPGADGIRTKDGQRLELATFESQNYVRSREVLQLIAQQWAQVGVQLHVRSGDSGTRAVDSLDPEKTPLIPAMVGRADPDVIKSNYYPTNRNLLLQKGGVSDKVQHFVDARLNGLFDAVASEPDPHKRLALLGDVQRYLVEQAYTIPLVEEPQVYAGAPWVKDVAFEAVGRPYLYATWIDAQ